MARAELLDDVIAVETEYRERDLIKAVPGAKYDSASRSWSLPVSWASCWTLRGVFGDRIEIGPELKQWVEDELERRVNPALDAREAALSPEGDAEGDSRLYPFQRAGVAFLAAAGSSVLADEMGTGKTVQAIAFLEREDAYPALIVCTNSVKHAWAHHFAEWAPERRVVVVGGTAKKRRDALTEEADVYVINWDALRYHSRLAPYGSIRLSEKERTPGELNRRWAAVIADEAHRAKDPKAKQTRALWAIGATAARRVAMTGTPVANNPADFWSLLHFVSPWEWPARTKFIDRYCLTSWNAWGGQDVVGIRPELRDEFFAIVDPRYLRRPKSVVLSQLPEKVYMTRTVELTAKQASAYKSLQKESLALLESGALFALNDLTLHTRLSQFASAYAELDDEGKVHLSEPSSKLDALEDLLDELGDEPLVVFAASRQLIELAAARLDKRKIEYGLVTGRQSPEERDRAVRRFQAGQDRVILLTLGAGSEGLTLTKASHLVFLQRSWSLVENKQAEDRVHRPGAEQHESITIIDIIAEGTVDEDVISALEQKGNHLESIARDEETVRRWLEWK